MLDCYGSTVSSVSARTSQIIQFVCVLRRIAARSYHECKIFMYSVFCTIFVEGNVSTNFGKNFKVKEIRPEEFTPAYADRLT